MNVLKITAVSIVFVIGMVAAHPVISADETADPVVTVESAEKPAVDPDGVAMPVEESRIAYELPYPGILPDHPLYFFKKIRDQILERLISDPLRKIEFYVLQSDKSLNSGIFLNEQKKSSLAQDEIALSVDYKKKAVEIASSVQKDRKDIPPYIRERMKKSTAKQAEILGEMKSQLMKDNAEFLDGMLKSVTAIQADLESL